MSINSLHYDILHRIFAIIRRQCDVSKPKNYKKLVGVSSVCSYWRALAVPILYEKILVNHAKHSTKSNALLALSSGFVDHTRVLEIHIKGTTIDTIDLPLLLDNAGVGCVVWHKINRLIIKNDYGSCTKVGQLSKSAAEAQGALDYLIKRLPGLSWIDCQHEDYTNFKWDTDSDYSYWLLSTLVSGYSARLCRLDLRVYVDRLAASFLFPQHMTHLSIYMGGYEKQIVAKICASTLQYLKITHASPDITWSWFYSSSTGDKVCFTSLKHLVVEFVNPLMPLPSYHSGQLDNTSLDRFKSDYQERIQSVQFPVLEKLKIKRYPYHDSSFYKLFDSCALTSVDVESPRSFGHYIPAQMVAGSRHMDVKIEHDNWQFNNNLDDAQSPDEMRRSAYEESIANLMSSPSKACSAIVTVPISNTLSITGEIEWSLVQRLELRAYIDMPSAFAVLTQMTKLKHLDLYFDSAYLNSAHKVEHTGRVNRCLNHITLFLGNRDELSKSGLLFCLFNLLPHVPSLLKLDMHSKIVGTAKEIVSNPANSLEWIWRQLEIVGWL